MPTLLDTPEFALAKTTLDETLQRIEKARQDRLAAVRKYLEMSETELERVKKQALALPTDIARYRAEIARLEATTGADILREAMGQKQPQTDELPRPIPGCKHIAEDGTCGHPEALTPECHLGVVCAAKAEKTPHACPRCDKRMQKVEVTTGPYEGEIWRLVSWDEKANVFTLSRDEKAKRFARQDCRFIHPDVVPPPSEWCDGSGKGGAE